MLLIEQVKREIIKDAQGFTLTGELSKKVEKLIRETVGELNAGFLHVLLFVCLFYCLSVFLSVCLSALQESIS